MNNNAKRKQTKQTASAPRPSLPRSKEKNIVIEGVYANARFMQAATSLVGCVVLLQVKNGDLYEGVMHTFSSQFEVALDWVHKCDPNNKDALPTRDEITNKMVFKPQDIVMITATNVDLDYATRDSFATDSSISKYNGKIEARDLQPWDDTGEDGDFEEAVSNSHSLEDANGGWDAREMFQTNEDKYGVKTTYDSSLKEYTVQIAKEDSDEYRRKEELAMKKAIEIESSQGYKQRADVENGDDEEERFSAVVRPSNDGHSTSNSTPKYIPPNKRKQLQPQIVNKGYSPRLQPSHLQQHNASHGIANSSNMSSMKVSPTMHHQQHRNSGSPAHHHHPHNQHARSPITLPVSQQTLPPTPHHHHQHHHHQPPQYPMHRMKPHSPQGPPQQQQVIAQSGGGNNNSLSPANHQNQDAAKSNVDSRNNFVDKKGVLSNRDVKSDSDAKQRQEQQQQQQPLLDKAKPPPDNNIKSITPSTAPSVATPTTGVNRSECKSSTPEAAVKKYANYDLSTTSSAEDVSSASDLTPPSNKSSDTTSASKKTNDADDKLAATVKKSNLNPNAKEFVFNPARSFTPRSPQTPTPPTRPHATQSPIIPAVPTNFQHFNHQQMIATPQMISGQPTVFSSISASGIPGAPQSYMVTPATVSIASSHYNPVGIASLPQVPRYRKGMQVAAATGTPLLAPSVSLPSGGHPQFAVQYPPTAPQGMVTAGPGAPQPAVIPYHHQMYSVVPPRVFNPQTMTMVPTSVNYEQHGAMNSHIYCTTSMPGHQTPTGQQQQPTGVVSLHAGMVNHSTPPTQSQATTPAGSGVHPSASPVHHQSGANHPNGVPPQPVVFHPGSNQMAPPPGPHPIQAHSQSNNSQANQQPGATHMHLHPSGGNIGHGGQHSVSFHSSAVTGPPQHMVLLQQGGAAGVPNAASHHQSLIPTSSAHSLQGPHLHGHNNHGANAIIHHHHPGATPIPVIPTSTALHYIHSHQQAAVYPHNQ